MGISDNAGAVVERYRYTSYGETSDSSSVELEPNFGGMRYWAVPRMYIATYRFMFPEHGMWLSPDPLGYIDSPNLYAYAGQNPIDFIDPLGLSKENCPADVKKSDGNNSIMTETTNNYQRRRKFLQSLIPEAAPWMLNIWAAHQPFTVIEANAENSYTLNSFEKKSGLDALRVEYYHPEIYEDNDMLNLDNFSVAMNMLVEFVKGVGPQKRVFNNDNVARALGNSVGVNKLRNMFYNKLNKKDIPLEGGFIYNVGLSFGYSELSEADNDIIEQFVGGFDGYVYSTGNELVFLLMNETSVESLLYHMPGWIEQKINDLTIGRIPPMSIPMALGKFQLPVQFRTHDRSEYSPGGTTLQYYIIREKINLKRLK